MKIESFADIVCTQNVVEKENANAKMSRSGAAGQRGSKAPLLSEIWRVGRTTRSLAESRSGKRYPGM
jgi:hypothetical protein